MGRMASDRAPEPVHPRHMARGEVSALPDHRRRPVRDRPVGLATILRPLKDDGDASRLVSRVDSQRRRRRRRVPAPRGESGAPIRRHALLDRAGAGPRPALPIGTNRSYCDPGMDVRGRRAGRHHELPDGDRGPPGPQRAFPVPGVLGGIDGRWDSSHAGGIRPGDGPPPAVDLPSRRAPGDRGHVDDPPVRGLRVLPGRPAPVAGHVPLETGGGDPGPRRGRRDGPPFHDADAMGGGGRGAPPDGPDPRQRDQGRLADPGRLRLHRGRPGRSDGPLARGREPVPRAVLRPRRIREPVRPGHRRGDRLRLAGGAGVVRGQAVADKAPACLLPAKGPGLLAGRDGPQPAGDDLPPGAMAGFPLVSPGSSDSGPPRPPYRVPPGARPGVGDH